MPDGKWAMAAGDANCDGIVDYTDDIIGTWAHSYGAPGYQPADLNLSGDVDYSEDILSYWATNYGRQTLVP